MELLRTPDECFENVTGFPFTPRYAQDLPGFAGLSDFPHYGAYRVTAPLPDAWRKYERWGKERISWGAALATGVN